MKKVIIAFTLLSYNLFGQDGQLHIIDKSTNPGEVIDELPLPPPRLEGQFYLESDWQYGNVILKNGAIIKNHKLKYDLQNNLLEIETEDGIKVCKIGLIAKFNLDTSKNDSSYYNLANISSNSLNGIGLILFQDQVVLVEKYYTSIKKADYNIALNVGDKNHQVSVKTKYYILRGSKAYELKSNMKKNKHAFLDKHSEIFSYTKANKLKPKSQKDMIQIISYYNSLL